jgi:ABC-type antimicrobial peptide transport system permease subunit
MNFVLRASVPYDRLAPQFRHAVQSLDAALPVIRMRSMDDVIDAAVARPRFMTILLGVFAGLALLLAAVGTYGVLSYLVSERKQEIGIRMALGAQLGDVRAMFLRHGLWLTITGIAIGIGVALMLTRVMSAFLFGVGPMDPLTYAAVSGVLALLALTATYLPARRAARVDPVVALRAEA